MNVKINHYMNQASYTATAGLPVPGWKEGTPPPSVSPPEYPFSTALQSAGRWVPRNFVIISMKYVFMNVKINHYMNQASYTATAGGKSSESTIFPQEDAATCMGL